ncbi:MAG: hypothetical protein ACI4T6_02465 [Candidatus Flemingiibacterium sp.]
MPTTSLTAGDIQTTGQPATVFRRGDFRLKTDELIVERSDGRLVGGVMLEDECLFEGSIGRSCTLGCLGVDADHRRCCRRFI